MSNQQVLGAFFIGMACLAAITFVLAGDERDTDTHAAARELRVIKLTLIGTAVLTWVFGVLLIGYGGE